MSTFAIISLLSGICANLAAAEGSEIPAQSVVSVDLQTGSVLVNQDAGDVVQTPGFNRLLTVCAALLLWPDAHGSTIVVSGADLHSVSADGPMIEAGTSATFDEIVRAALIAGRPEAARSLARVAGSASGLVDAEAMSGFVKRANDLFIQTGLTNTRLDLDGSSTTTSAAELAQLIAYVLDSYPLLTSVFSSTDAAVDGRMVPSLLTTDGQQLAGVAAPENQSAVLISTHGQRSVVAVLLGAQSEEWLSIAGGVVGQSLAMASTTDTASYPKLPALASGGLLQRAAAPATVNDAQMRSATSELTVRKLMLRWPLVILSILMLAAVVTVQRPEIRRLRSKPAGRRAKRASASPPGVAPQVAPYTSWETEPQTSTAGD